MKILKDMAYQNIFSHNNADVSDQYDIVIFLMNTLFNYIHETFERKLYEFNIVSKWYLCKWSCAWNYKIESQKGFWNWWNKAERVLGK